MTTVTVNTTLVERPTLFAEINGYNVAEIIIPNFETAAGGGAGDPVTTSIAFGDSTPTNRHYTVECTPSQPCAVSYDNKEFNGFDLILTPLSSSDTLLAGTVDLRITWHNGQDI